MHSLGAELRPLIERETAERSQHRPLEDVIRQLCEQVETLAARVAVQGGIDTHSAILALSDQLHDLSQREVSTITDALKANTQSTVRKLENSLSDWIEHGGSRGWKDGAYGREAVPLMWEGNSHDEPDGWRAQLHAKDLDNERLTLEIEERTIQINEMKKSISELQTNIVLYNTNLKFDIYAESYKRKQEMSSFVELILKLK